MEFPMNQENNHPDTTTTSFDAMEEVMGVQIKKRRIVRLLSSLLFVGICVFLVLFFTLPCFQASGMNLTGNVFFSRENIVSLAGLDHYQASLLLDSKKAEDTLKENARGLLLNATIESNGMVASCKVEEDYPVSRFGGNTYFSSGISLEEADKMVEELPLSDAKKNQLSSSYHKLSQSNLPEIHFPEGTQANIQNAKVAFQTLSGIHPDVLNAMIGVQFINDNMDSNWSNVATVLFVDGGNYYRVDGFLTDRFSSYLPKNVFPDAAFQDIRNYIRMCGANLDKGEYHFQDSDKTYEAYHFKIVCLDGSYFLEGVKKS